MLVGWLVLFVAGGVGFVAVQWFRATAPLTH